MFKPYKLLSISLLAILMVAIIFTGCSSTKPEDQSYNFTPDSISNMVIQIEDNSLFELDNNQLYRIKNVNGAVIDEGKFEYRKVSGTDAYLSLNNFSMQIRFELYFDNPVHGQYRFIIVGSTTRGEGNFDILRGVDFKNKAHEKTKEFLFPPKNDGLDISPEYLVNKEYQFILERLDSKVVSEAISFLIKFEQNGIYHLTPIGTTDIPEHSGVYYYNKTGNKSAVCKLDGFINNNVFITYVNDDSGVFETRTETELLEGIFIEIQILDNKKEILNFLGKKK